MAFSECHRVIGTSRVDYCMLKGLFWPSTIACVIQNWETNCCASSAFTNDCTPGVLSHSSMDFKVVPRIDFLWSILGFHSLWLTKNTLRSVKPPVLCSHKFMRDGSGNDFEKVKTFLVLPSVRHLELLLKLSSKSRGYGKHFLRTDIHKKYSISPLMMDFME